MATKGNSNRTQKNGVRYALATAATVMTLLGAQSLAFAGKSTSSDQATQTTVAIIPTTDNIAQLITVAPLPTTATPPTVVTPMPTATQITVAAAQPAPRSQSSR